jgi:hypothetical protein
LIRGLCDIHYRRFLARIKSLTQDEGPQAAELFEADCLAKGWVTAKSKGGRPRDDDPFDAIAARIVAECKGLYTATEADATVADGDRVIKKAVPTRRKNAGTKAIGKKGVQ